MNQKKNRTLYVSDLDGTLLNSNSVLSDTTVEILNNLIDRGTLFTIATARTPATVDGLMKRVHATLPFIVMTGAAQWNGELVNRRYMRTERMEFLQEVCDKYGIRPFFYCYNDAEKIINAYHSPVMSECEHQFYDQRVNAPHKRFVLEDVPTEMHSKAMLMFASAEYEKIEKAYIEAKAALACSMTCYHDIFNHETGFFEVMAEGVSKAASVAEIARAANADEIIVFGDSPNDLSMREVATKFIAPTNASPEVLAVADEVIGTNDSDSVVKWIMADVAKGNHAE